MAKFQRKGEKMKKISNLILALSLVLVMTLSVFSSTVSASGVEIQKARSGEEESLSFERNEITLDKIPSRYIGNYKYATVKLNGKYLNIDARVINGEIYIPLRAFINATTNMKVSYNSVKRTLSVSGSGLYLEATDTSHVIYANGRPLFTMTPSVIMTNGRIYTPIEPIAKALGLSLSESSNTASLWGSIKPLLSADKFYREDAIYWLSRIINAESRGEAIHGQIAVGNVVMNRVNSNQYPNTIWGVIFDKKYGVQFSPILDGTINLTPTANSILAAKICLEGFYVSDEVLFFIAPRYASSSWIPRNRQYEFTIGNHDFYS